MFNFETVGIAILQQFIPEPHRELMKQILVLLLE